MKDDRKRNNNAREPRRLRPVVRWADVDAELLKAFVNTLVEAGCAVTLSRTLKGDTLSMVALAGEQRPKGYAQSLAEVPFEMADVLWELDIEAPALILELTGQA